VKAYYSTSLITRQGGEMVI